MFIVKGAHSPSKLRRSGISPAPARLHRAIDISLLRSWQHSLKSGGYKHLVPTGLFAVALGVVVVCAPSARTTKSNEQQMNVPENADYSKFQHTSAYHA